MSPGNIIYPIYSPLSELFHFTKLKSLDISFMISVHSWLLFHIFQLLAVLSTTLLRSRAVSSCLLVWGRSVNRLRASSRPWSREMVGRVEPSSRCCRSSGLVFPPVLVRSDWAREPQAPVGSALPGATGVRAVSV